jgi:hypothetical protein
VALAADAFMHLCNVAMEVIALARANNSQAAAAVEMIILPLDGIHYVRSQLKQWQASSCWEASFSQRTLPKRLRESRLKN